MPISIILNAANAHVTKTNETNRNFPAECRISVNISINKTETASNDIDNDIIKFWVTAFKKSVNAISIKIIIPKIVASGILWSIINICWFYLKS